MRRRWRRFSRETKTAARQRGEGRGSSNSTSIRSRCIRLRLHKSARLILEEAFRAAESVHRVELHFREMKEPELPAFRQTFEAASRVRETEKQKPEKRRKRRAMETTF